MYELNTAIIWNQWKREEEKPPLSSIQWLLFVDCYHLDDFTLIVYIHSAHTHKHTISIPENWYNYTIDWIVDSGITWKCKMNELFLKLNIAILLLLLYGNSNFVCVVVALALLLDSISNFYCFLFFIIFRLIIHHFPLHSALLSRI